MQLLAFGDNLCQKISMLSLTMSKNRVEGKHIEFCEKKFTKLIEISNLLLKRWTAILRDSFLVRTYHERPEELQGLYR
jgi:hypothetical protein